MTECGCRTERGFSRDGPACFEQVRRESGRESAAGRSRHVGETARQHAFEMLAAPLRSFLFRVALRLTRQPQDAEDAVQETFLKAYRSFAGFRTGTSFHAWIHRILLNHLINQYPKRFAAPLRAGGEAEEAFPAHLPTSIAAQGDPESLAIQSLTGRTIRAAIAALPQAYRAVVILSVVEGYTYQEIARKLNCPVGTVRSRVHRGRKQVRGSLRDEIASIM